MKITLTKPPILNSLYGNNQYGGKYLKEAGREWKNSNGWILKSLKEKFKGKVSLKIILYTCRKQDNDSILKILFDTIQYSGVIEDDYQIFDLRVLKEVVEKKAERIWLEIEEIK